MYDFQGQFKLLNIQNRSNSLNCCNGFSDCHLTLDVFLGQREYERLILEDSMNHMQSLCFEYKLYAQMKQKTEEMQHSMPLIEMQFLKAMVMPHSCTWMSSPSISERITSQSIIVENNQADLEMPQRCSQATSKEVFPKIHCRL